MRRPLIIFLFLALPSFAAAQFTRDLYFGLRGDSDVVRLQDFLRSRGYFSYPISTGNYFTATLDAVKKFQQARGIQPVAGYFGSKSRVAANQLLAEAPPLPRQPSPTPAPSPTAAATTSPFQKKIVINSLSGTSGDPLYESITLENKHSSERINITGFKIETVTGQRFVIPNGHEVPGLYPVAADPIVLKSGERAVITVGKQARRLDFRINLCTGYFDETSSFTPSLWHQCPKVDTRTLYQFSDRCIDWINSISRCRTTPPGRIADQDCNKFIADHFSYAGCVTDYRSRPDFFSDEWRIWMQRDQEFFRNSREKVTLKDAQGKIVDERSY